MEPGRLTLTVLGCDGSYPGPGGACSGYLVQCGGTSICVDAGTGTLANLQTHIPLEQLDAVFLSHSHPDHWLDLEGLAVAFKWFMGRKGLPVYAPGDIRDLMRVGSASEVFDWHLIDEETRATAGCLSVDFCRTDHPVTTFAMRVEGDGRALGYSADSGAAWRLSSLGPDLDLALCEATFLADREGTVQHLSARQAGLTAKEAGVPRLMITHISPGIDRDAARLEAEAAFGSAVEVASIGGRYEV